MLKRLLKGLLRGSPGARGVAAPAATRDAFAEVAAQLARRELGDAEAALRAAMQGAPGNPRGLFLGAELLRLRERHAEAMPAYRRALLADNRNADAWAGLGDCWSRTGERAQAFICYRNALQLAPARADILNEMGVLSLAWGNYADAADFFERAVNADPLNADAWNNAGLLAASRRSFEQARRNFHRASHLRPGFYMALCNLGLACRDLGRLAEAEEALRQAAQSAPGKPTAWANLAAVLQDAGDLAGAEQALARALEAAPGSVSVLTAFGALRARQGDIASAERMLGEALAQAPDDAEANLAQAHLDLLLGRFETGWERYEARLRASQSPRRRFPFAEWDGGDPAGRTLLVYAEQGLGDTLMFASCLPDLLAELNRCFMHCEDRLWPLLQRSFPGLARYESPERTPADAYLPIGSLPRRYRRSPPAFPRHAGYLAADAQRTAEARAALGEGFNVGIAWRGGLPSTGRAMRSLELADLLPVLRVEGVSWVSLQHDARPEEAAGFARDTGVRLRDIPGGARDLEAMAAAIAACDLVITVCSSVVHLAGGLGRPAWVLTPQVPAWRYQLRGDSMPWYPSVRLWRQSVAGAWPALLDAVRRELAVVVQKGVRR